MTSLDILLGIVGIVLTVMIFSYLLGDNFFFRIALYILIGVSIGYTAAVLIIRVIIPYLVKPLQGASTPVFLISLVPLVLCVLLMFMIIPRTAQAGRLPMAFLVGMLAALAIAGISRGTLAPQLLSIVNRFSPALLQQGDQADWAKIVEAVTMVLGVIAVLFFFHHRTSKNAADGSRGGFVEGLSGVGQVFIGITFGMLFVGFYSTALVALISRLTSIQDFLVRLFTS
ncbi:MAG: hypothetical protein AB2L21_05890 [Anaerolineaceae bacterium]|jgi:hypothetical protein